MNLNPKKKPLYNPLSHDFIVERLDDSNKPYTLTMPSEQLSFWVEYEAEFLKKRLLDELYQKEGNIRVRRDLEYERLLKKIVPEDI